MSPVYTRFSSGLALCLIACSNSGGDAAPAGPLPGAIRCTYAYRASNEVGAGQTGEEPDFQFQEQELRVGPDERAGELLGQIRLEVDYSADEFEGSSFRLAALAGDAALLSVLYQFSDGLPQNQFSGGHGFTGLMYLTHPTGGGDYQVFCEVEM